MSNYIPAFEFGAMPLEEKLRLTYCMANFDSYLVWEMFVDNPNKKSVDYKQYPPVLDFEQCSRGEMITVGRLADMPVSITIFWHRLNGKYFGFWEATSQVVDHRLIDAWFKEKYSGHNADEEGSILGYILKARKETPQVKMDDALS